MISLADIGYAAGFYEGEGSFIKATSGTTSYVSITQKDIEPLLKMQKLFGGTITQYNGYNYWRLFGVECRGFVLTIFTLLSARRRKQILKNVEFFTELDTCPNGHVYLEGTYKIVSYEGRNPSRKCLKCEEDNKLRKESRKGLTIDDFAILQKAMENIKKDGLLNN